MHSLENYSSKYLYSHYFMCSFNYEILVAGIKN